MLLRALSAIFLAFLVAGPRPAMADSPAHPSAGQIVATVDLQRAMREIDEGKQSLARLDQMYQGKKAQIEQLETNIRSLQQEYQSKQAVLSDAGRQDYEQRIGQLQQEYQQTVMRSDQEMQRAQGQVMQQLLPKLQEIAGAIAGERGYTVVLEASSVVWAASEVDITDELVRRANAPK